MTNYEKIKAYTEEQKKVNIKNYLPCNDEVGELFCLMYDVIRH